MVRVEMDPEFEKKLGLSFKPIEIKAKSDLASIERQIREQLKAQGATPNDAEVRRLAKKLAEEEKF